MGKHSAVEDETIEITGAHCQIAQDCPNCDWCDGCDKHDGGQYGLCCNCSHFHAFYLDCPIVTPCGNRDCCIN